MSHIANNLVETVGNTPLIKLKQRYQGIGGGYSYQG